MGLVQRVNDAVAFGLLLVFLGAGLTKLSARLSPEVFLFHKSFFERITGLWHHRVFNHFPMVSVTPMQFQRAVGALETLLGVLVCFWTRSDKYKYSDHL